MEKSHLGFGWCPYIDANGTFLSKSESEVIECDYL